MSDDSFVSEGRLGVALVADFLVTACDGSTEVLQTGFLRVTASTSGGDLDPDGYTFWLAGPFPHSIGVIDTLVFRRLPEGAYEAELRDVAPNCSLLGTNPREVSLLAGRTAKADSAMTCVGT